MASGYGSSGSFHWERVTRTIHDIAFSIDDDLLSRIENGDTVRLHMTSRQGTAVVTLTYAQLRNLLEGDPRTRRNSPEVEQY